MKLRNFRTVAALATLAACSFDPSGGASPPDDIGDAPDEPADPGDDPGGDGDVGGDEEPAPLASCAEYLAADPGAASMVYTIDPGDGGAPFDAYCEMEIEGGGWTLALKADGRSSRFNWSAPYWTTTDLWAADSPGLDHTEAKLDSFNRLPFTQVLVVFETPVDSGDRGWVFFEATAASLLEVFSSGQTTEVAAGRDTWLDAIPNSDLENDCDLEGFNVGPSVSRVRLGVVGAKGDEECDARKDAISKLGIGGSLSDCNDCTDCGDHSSGSLSGPSVGNNQSGCDTIASFATVYVR
jgi:hypothetical protein